MNTTQSGHKAAIHEAVRGYIRSGWVPIPLEGKKPKDSGWPSATAPADEDIPALYPAGTNVGILLGSPSGNLIDVDVDDSDALKWARIYLPKTEATFGRGKDLDRHRLYIVNDEPFEKTIQYKDGPTVLLEIRSTGGQTMVPPSIHPSGEPVTWQGGGDPATVARYSLEATVGIVAAGTLLGRWWNEAKNSRHNATLALAGMLVRAGWDDWQIHRFVSEICSQARDEEISDRLRAVDDTIATYHAEEPVTGWRTLAEMIGQDRAAKLRTWLMVQDSTFPNSDVDNAADFAERFSSDLRYAAGLGYLAWNGRHWEPGAEGQAIELAKRYVKDLEREAISGAEEEADVPKRLAHARKSQAGHKVREIVRLAESDPRLRLQATDFDNEPWRLNVANGVVNLMTGGLAPHSREHLMTKGLDIPYHLDAECPDWRAFLEHAFDPPMIEFMQRVFGYIVTGHTREQVFFLLTGVPASGKSTLIEVLLALLGPYGSKLPPDVFTRRSGSNPQRQLAPLPGLRFVTSNELARTDRFNVELMKDLAGDDQLSATPLYKDPLMIRSTAKIMLYGNFRPEADGDDGGFWRRALVIEMNRPIEARIPGFVRDVLLPELPGILTWAVDGAVAWAEGGLQVPEAVRAATERYRADNDVLGDYLAERCVFEDGAKVEAGALHVDYVDWCKSHGIRHLDRRNFGRELTPRVGKAWESNGRYYRRGLRLRSLGYGWSAAGA